MDLLFERFLSEERGEWPDIDIDLPSGDKRERAIQYVYQRFGKLGAAMTANVISYRGRSAAREVGKALGFEITSVERLPARGLCAPASADQGGRRSALNHLPWRRAREPSARRRLERREPPRSRLGSRTRCLAAQLSPRLADHGRGRRSSPRVSPTMDRGLEIAASGMLTELVRQDSIASDLANASTPGYKPEVVAQSSFGDVLNVDRSAPARARPRRLRRADLEDRDRPDPGAARADRRAARRRARTAPASSRPDAERHALHARRPARRRRARARSSPPTGDPVLDPTGKPITIGAHADRPDDRDRRHDHRRRQDARHDRRRLAHEPGQGRREPLHRHARREAGRARRSTRARSRAPASNPTTVMIDMIVSLRAYESSQRVIHSIDETLSRGDRQRRRR